MAFAVGMEQGRGALAFPSDLNIESDAFLRRPFRIDYMIIFCAAQESSLFLIKFGAFFCEKLADFPLDFFSGH
nr:hypothetical protein [uncultured Oscillibacter sp.]